MNLLIFYNDIYLNVVFIMLLLKVEIIGDVYMVVFGFLVRNGQKYVMEIVNMFLSIMKVVQEFKVKYKLDEKLMI